MKVIRMVLYRGGVPAIIGRVISPSTPTESLVKPTRGAKTGLSKIGDRFILTNTL